MAVLEHDIHPRTQHGEEFRYGCHNRSWDALGYHTSVRYYRPDGTFYFRKKFVEHRMSKECRFDLSLTDNGCRECKHRGSGEAYNEMVRRLGK